ncbi:MAG: LysM peptidoglycan-binding domain-containing protein [Bacteroidales bacterium]|nr:LysM peptidoglycan-binding domain-containing protein [Bacteroidales bacterium]
MRVLKIYFSVLAISLMTMFFAPSLKAQVSAKSSIVTEYNGKQYYVHTVQKRQSLNEIAEIYGVSVYEILSENKDLKKTNPKAGTIIRIPYKEIIVEEEPKEMLDEIIEQDSLAFEPEFVPTSFDSERLYKVALMMPLYLEQVDEKFLNEEVSNKQLLAKPFSYLHFYEGFMIAVDSMVSKYDMKIDLKVYDIDQDTNKIVTALNDEWLATADMIVGPFHLKPFERMLNYVKDKDILLVNPMTNREDLVIDNKNMVKVKPSYSYQMHWLEEVIKDKYTDNNIFIFAMDSASMQYTEIMKEIALRNIEEFSYVPNKHIKKVIRKYQDALKNEEIEFDSTKYQSDNITFDVKMINEFPDDTTKLRNQVVVYNYSIDSLNKVMKTASAFRNNLFIVYGDSKVFATEMINKLNILNKDYPVSLIALPDWSKYDRLFNENLMKLNTIIFDDDYTDYDTYAVGKFICKFRDEYGTEPKDIAFHGFNIAWYFLNALINYGDDIAPAIPTFDIPLLNTKYHFEKKSINDGYENSYWNVYQYKDYEKQLLQYE